MLELTRPYEAHFLGQEVLTSAVTSDLLRHLVHELPEVTQGGSQCTVMCSASGLTVTREGSSVLRVPLPNILFCHVDKARPEVTVWVVRTRQTGPSTSGVNGVNLSAYVYKCLNPSDAVGLFQTFNEMNRQAKLDKYRRNVDKRKDDVLPALTSGSKDTDSDGSSSSGVSSGSNTSLAALPAVTVLSTTAGRYQSPNNKKSSAASRPWTKVNANATIGNFAEEDLTCPTWTSIAGSIETYRRSFSALRPRDKEVRLAVLEELREKLRSRYVSSEVKEAHPLADPSQHNVRQRKPAKIITESAEKVPNRGSRNFQFPFSMGNMMKKLVIKSRNPAGAAFSPMPPVQGQMWMPVKGPLTLPTALPIANHSPTRKFKSKKGPAPVPPTIIPRMVSNGVDPYFYLPPITKDGRTDVFVPVLPSAWIHQQRPKEGGVVKGRKGTSAMNSINDVKKGKKKVLTGHGLGRFRGQKKRSPSFVGANNFNRSASTTSRGSTSSDSGAEGKLRSVMKKPKQRQDNSPPEQKKNVTFHAYATVQVLP